VRKFQPINSKEDPTNNFQFPAAHALGGSLEFLGWNLEFPASGIIQILYDPAS
jgi:hypothetical protein